jgi:hypothetical protein
MDAARHAPDPPPATSSPRAADSGRSVLALLLAAVALLLARLPVLPHRRFDPDELEHAHAAWCFSKGLIPYKDFFEHHTPWYYYTLRPFFAWIPVDASLADGREFFLVGRLISFALTILAVAVVYRIGRLWLGRVASALAAVLLLAQPVFLQKTIEMRPDILALPFFLAGLWGLVRGLRAHAANRRGTVLAFFVGGLAVGGAIMSTQKMLFVLPGICVGLGLWVLLASPRRGLPGRFGVALVFAAGVAVPALVTLAVFAAHGAAREFVTNNFLLNARWKHFATNQFEKLLLTSSPVFVLAVTAAYADVARWLRTRRCEFDRLLLITTAAFLFVGVLIVPVAHRQYYLMPLPILCLLAVDGLAIVRDRLAGRARRPLAVIGLVLMLLFPILALVDAYRDTNAAQLARLDFVYRHTRPTDLVMDGWEGMGVFRPHAFHYYFLHEEAVAMLPPDRLAAYLDALEQGRIQPRLIAMDENLPHLGPRFVAFVERNYVTQDGFFYLRK